MFCPRKKIPRIPRRPAKKSRRLLHLIPSELNSKFQIPRSFLWNLGVQFTRLNQSHKQFTRSRGSWQPEKRSPNNPSSSNLPLGVIFSRANPAPNSDQCLIPPWPYCPQNTRTPRINNAHASRTCTYTRACTRGNPLPGHQLPPRGPLIILLNGPRTYCNACMGYRDT